MSTNNLTAPAIRPHPVDDTVRQAMDLLIDRESALSDMIDAAQARCDVDELYKLDIRHSEVCGLIVALRNRVAS